MNASQLPIYPRPASVLYYLDHFQSALHWLQERYGDLLADEESAFIRGFGRLPRGSQALLVRLIMRKGRRFRASRINYPEIGSVTRALGPLIELRWLDPRPQLSIEELAKLLTRLELIGQFTELPASISKAQAQNLLRTAYLERRTFEEWRGNVSEAVYAVDVAGLCTRLRLLFFGNFRQQWAEFVLADLGIFRYEAVPFSSGSRAFQTRKDIEDFYRLYECRRRLHDGEPLPQVLDHLPRDALDHAWLESRRAKLLFQIAARYQRAGERAQALTLYKECRHPGARLRAIRVLETDAQYRDAYELAYSALQAPESDAEEQRLTRLVHRLERRFGLSARVRNPPARPARLDLIVPASRAGESVERIAIEHVAARGAPVYFVENTLVNSLFGLLCWEAIFAPVSGAFFHPFQAAPVDLFSPGFRNVRRERFDGCLARLESGCYREAIKETYQAKRGIQAPFVCWSVLTLDLLSSALDCIPAAHLRVFFERLLSNLPENRTGLPDLVQFWVDEKRYRLIEVKGPGDGLQDNQQRWFDFFSRHEIPVAICHVRWAETA